MGANAAILVQLVLGLIDRAAAYGALLNKARAEGRDVSDAELDGLASDDDAWRQKQKDAIAKARAEGR